MLAVSVIKDAYVKIAGLRECASFRCVEPCIPAAETVGVGIFGTLGDPGAASRERSSMKLPVARLFGVRGRCRSIETSYGCSEAKE